MKAKKLSIFIVSVFALIVLAFSAASANYAEVAVGFEEQYAKPGTTLHAKVDGMDGKKLSYVWYVNGTKQKNTGSTFSLTEKENEKMIRVEVYDGNQKASQNEIFVSTLPVIYIDTNGKAIASKEDYIDATMRITGNDEYRPEDTTLYDGKIEIKGHGNTTWKYYDKKPYKVKLDKSTSVFDFGKNKHWLLIANYIDESLMRNMLSQEISKHFGAKYLKSTWVDLVLNGECVGNYQFFEQAKISESRVDIFDWEDAAEDTAKAIAKKEKFSDEDKDELSDYMEQNLAWITSGKVEFKGKVYKISDYSDDIPFPNGGFLMEMDTQFDEISKFRTNRDCPVMFKSPEFINTNTTMFNSIRTYIQEFEDALYTNDKHIKVNGKYLSYQDYCDFNSMLTYWLASEITFCEAGYRSTYFYKDLNDKIYFGPEWDFDFGSGSVAPHTPGSAYRWHAQNGRWWFQEAMKDPYFAVKARELFLDKSDFLDYCVKDDGLIDQWFNKLYASGINNNNLWLYSRGYEKDTVALKQWMKNRISWLNAQFISDEVTAKSFNVVLSDNIKLSLTAESDMKMGDCGYITLDTNDYVRLVVKAPNDYNKYKYYINGKYVGSSSLSNGSAEILIPCKLFKEDLNKKNVITVWTLDSQGNPSEQQFVTLTLTDNIDSFNQIKLIQDDNVKTIFAQSGSTLILPSVILSNNTDCEEWYTEDNSYGFGEKIIVKDNMTLLPKWKLCKDGSINHEFEKMGDGSYSCKKGCSTIKKDDTNYTDIMMGSVSISNRYSNTFTGKPIVPTITVTYAGRNLEEGKDYSISIRNNVNTGFASYTITGIKKAGFNGQFDMSFRIIPRKISTVTVSAANQIYTGSETSPKLTLTYGSYKLAEGKDYKITSIKNNVTVGTATVELEGIGNFNGKKTVTFKITAQSATASLSKTKLVYNGKSQSVTVTAKSKTGITLKNGTDYTVSGSLKATKPGTYKVTVKFKGNYTGSKTLSYTVKPNKVTSLKASAQTTSSLKLTWKKLEEAEKYEIWKSTDGKKWTKVTTVKTNSAVVSKLKAGQAVQFKVRAVAGGINGDFSSVVKTSTKTQAPSISVSSTSKGKLTASWKAVSGANEYILEYSTDKTFKKGVKKTTLKAKTLKATVSSTSGKTVYVRVRAVTSAKVTSANSSVKSVKVK